MPTSVHEIAIAAALSGGLLALTALALAEWLTEGRGVGALRNLVFVALTGTAVVLIIGLPEALWPALESRVLRMLRASLGPLAASTTLYYLGQWAGGMRQDPVMNRITNWSAAVMLVVALGLALAGLLVPPERFRDVFMLTAISNVLAVLPGFAAAFRAAKLGDRLARGMAGATTVLAAVTTGLYSLGLSRHDLGAGAWALTAVLTLTFVILTSTVVSVRNRELRRLGRLSRIEPGVEPATQLPTGSHLLRKVEDAFWTAGRRQAQCAVVCIYLDNLYELDAENRSAEYQLLAAMAARIRRAAGFRGVVGIDHPRCFMAVLALEADRQPFAAMLRACAPTWASRSIWWGQTGRRNASRRASASVWWWPMRWARCRACCWTRLKRRRAPPCRRSSWTRSIERGRAAQRPSPSASPGSACSTRCQALRVAARACSQVRRDLPLTLSQSRCRSASVWSQARPA